MAVYKTVCITGANRGLGLEMVRLFLQHPQPPKHIIAICRNPESAKELQDLSRKHPNVVHSIQLDVTDTIQYDRVIKQVQGIVGQSGINLLVNNAGIYNKGLANSIEAFTKEELLTHFDVNAISPILLTKAFHPLLRQASSSHENPADARKSVVAFISSKLGCFYINSPMNHPYRFTKAALNMAAHCLAGEWKDQGILVTLVHPGWVKTDMGGPGADIDIHTSVSGIVKVLLDVSEKNRGRLFQYDGTPLEW